MKNKKLAVFNVIILVLFITVVVVGKNTWGSSSDNAEHEQTDALEKKKQLEPKQVKAADIPLLMAASFVKKKEADLALFQVEELNIEAMEDELEEEEELEESEDLEDGLADRSTEETEEPAATWQPVNNTSGGDGSSVSSSSSSGNSKSSSSSSSGESNQTKKKDKPQNEKPKDHSGNKDKDKEKDKSEEKEDPPKQDEDKNNDAGKDEGDGDNTESGDDDSDKKRN